MKIITEYLSSKVKPSIIYATDNTIDTIIKQEFKRLGLQCSLNHIDVSKITDMNSLFDCSGSSTDIGLGEEYKELDIDISKWNVSNVTDMQYMFLGCKKFNSDLSDWNVENVKIMHSMFNGCELFDSDISRWNVSNVENMDHMFAWCKNFNQDISQWNTNNVKKFNGIFSNCNIQENYMCKFVK